MRNHLWKVLVLPLLFFVSCAMQRVEAVPQYAVSGTWNYNHQDSGPGYCYYVRTADHCETSTNQHDHCLPNSAYHYYNAKGAMVQEMGNWTCDPGLIGTPTDNDTGGYWQYSNQTCPAYHTSNDG